ncbi:hypothetical protein HDV57DRAFT_396087 [Trichoderma longibrachiatum]|uniref:Uncharacterized protein n=1 Tax=Trichoderma longibrachiatum ATCC 18648 TaxID=983965 RepID=A0A2T4C3F5_TRILO|nr:hypothetical protein M440DRAFT_1244426 [Trichoderma longibrachiatum ATCC 18648]
MRYPARISSYIQEIALVAFRCPSDALSNFKSSQHKGKKKRTPPPPRSKVIGSIRRQQKQSSSKSKSKQPIAPTRSRYTVSCPKLREEVKVAKEKERKKPPQWNNKKKKQNQKE